VLGQHSGSFAFDRFFPLVPALAALEGLHGAEVIHGSQFADDGDYRDTLVIACSRDLNG
jgi:hypothetical protein